MLIGGDGLYRQKIDPATGNLLPISSISSLDNVPLNDLLNHDTDFDNFFFDAISDDGNFIAGTATNQSTGQDHAVIMLNVDLSVDANRDGVVSLTDDDDDPTQDKPFRFWLNHDTDDSDTEEEPATTPDYSNSTIDTQRDLEDFARLWFSAPYDGSIVDWPDNDTPDNDLDAFSRTLGFYDQVPIGQATIWNMYLTSDPATTTAWETNNFFLKPYPLGDRWYNYDEHDPPGQKVALTFITQFGRWIDEPIESMAYATVSRSQTLGSKSNVRRAVYHNDNLEFYDFDESVDSHSAQLIEPNQKLDSFFDTIKLFSTGE